MRIIEEVQKEFLFGLCNEFTARKIQEYLKAKYPEATWTVRFDDRDLELKAEFATPEEETFYMLKWL